MCHRLFTKGEAQLKVGKTSVPLEPEKLRGRLSFIYFIRNIYAEDPIDNNNKSKWPGYKKLYANFLNYVSFWGITQPTIVCEGKTDTIYIRSAIHSLKAKFPAYFALVGGKERLKLTFFKYTDTAKAVQDLSGGNGQLKNLVHEYDNRTREFKHIAKNAVILVTDVDKGAEELFKAMSKILGKKVSGDEPWYFIKKNLYVVPIPNKPGIDTAIEDLFEPKLLEYTIDGKYFDKTNHERDGDKFYSKFTFATKVVAAGKVPIDYIGFEPLLQAILDAQADYAKRIATFSVSSP